ncbi:MAG: TIR domain-containing protein [Myxococcaceae bacterium]
MARRVFVSYVFEDRAYRDQVVDWWRQGQLGDFEPVHEAEDVRQGGEAAIRGHLRPIMRDADGILVLVGQDTHSRRWVDEEIHHCASLGKPAVVTRLPNVTGAAPYEVRGHQVIPFSPQRLLEALVSAFGSVRR